MNICKNPERDPRRGCPVQMLTNAEEKPWHSHLPPQNLEHQTPVDMMQWWMSQTFSSPLFIFGNQGRPADLNVTQLNKAWWNTLLHVWSQDLYVISAHRKTDSTLNIPCLALTQTLAMKLAGLLFTGINKGNWRRRGRYCVCVTGCTDPTTLFLFAQTLAICLTLLLLRRDMFTISASLCVHVSVCMQFSVLMQASPAVCQVGLVHEGAIRPF